MGFTAPPRRQVSKVAAFVAASSVAIAAVVWKALRDSADPSRCANLVAMGTRCCAVGQVVEGARCVGRPERCPEPLVVTDLGCAVRRRRVAVPGGIVRAGTGDWEAEGRVHPHEAKVAPFEIDAFEITEGDYGECVRANRCTALSSTGEPGRALGGMGRADVEAYCAFRNGRLLTDDEWTLAAAGPGTRRYPWGETGAVCRRAAWGLADGPCGFGFVGPELAGAHPDGATPDGLYDLAGNVAEWVAGEGPDRPLPGRPGDARGAARGGSYATS